MHRAHPLLLACLLAAGCSKGESEWLADLSAQEPFARVLAVTALAESRKPEVLPHVLAALDDVSEDVRAAAGTALVRLGPAAVPALLDALRPGAPVAQREGALAGLPLLAPQAAEPLARCLLDEAWERPAVLKALERLGPAAGRPALAPLIAALRSPEPWRRCAAAEGLRAVDPTDRDVLAALLPVARDPDPQVRDAALKTSVAGLLLRLRTEDGLARHAAEVQLETLGTSAVPALARALREAREGEDAEPVAALAAHGPDGLLAALEALNPRDPQHVVRALSLTAAVGKDALPRLQQLHAGEPSPRRLLATVCLGALQAAARPATPALLADLRGTDPLQRWAAAHALGQIGPADDG
jgi:HEAT repeat protein